MLMEEPGARIILKADSVVNKRMPFGASYLDKNERAFGRARDLFTGPNGSVSDADEAEKANAGLNGKDRKGRPLTVNEARPPTDRPHTGGGGNRESV